MQFLGEGVSRQADYSRNMDAAKKLREEAEGVKATYDAWGAQLTKWHKDNLPIFEAGKKALSAGNGTGTDTGDPMTPRPPTSDLPDDVVRVADLDAREQNAAAYFELINSLAFTHLQKFGDVLDVTALRADAVKAKVDLVTAYNTKYADQIRAKAEAIDKERIDKIVAERLTEERKKFASQPPYPVGDMSGSPLDALEKKDGPSQFSADAAADEYAQLVQKRLAGAGV